MTFPSASENSTSPASSASDNNNSQSTQITPAALFNDGLELLACGDSAEVRIKGVEKIQLAAQQSHPPAINKLAHLFFRAGNYSAALKHARIAATLGEATSQLALVKIYCGTYKTQGLNILNLKLAEGWKTALQHNSLANINDKRLAIQILEEAKQLKAQNNNPEANPNKRKREDASSTAGHQPLTTLDNKENTETTPNPLATDPRIQISITPPSPQSSHAKRIARQRFFRTRATLNPSFIQSGSNENQLPASTLSSPAPKR